MKTENLSTEHRSHPGASFPPPIVSQDLPCVENAPGPISSMEVSTHGLD